jgi:hypothetical protein
VGYERLWGWGWGALNGYLDPKSKFEKFRRRPQHQRNVTAE